MSATGGTAITRSGSSSSARKSLVSGAGPRSSSPASTAPMRRLSTRTSGLSSTGAGNAGTGGPSLGAGPSVDAQSSTPATPASAMSSTQQKHESSASSTINRSDTPSRAPQTTAASRGNTMDTAERLGDITSPHELSEWVDIVLNQLEDKFDLLNGQVQERNLVNGTASTVSGPS
ncbi:hypothetical protein OC861_000844 [Tilletia horrida]|nr:hypothetical protein OC861_000844 [Tilletia horrida]